MRNQNEVLSCFKNWAENNEHIRAAIMASSRVRKTDDIDFLSDYDIELYVSEIETFKKSDAWLEVFGEVMVKWPYLPKSTGDEDWITRLILFDDGVRIDFQITDQTKIESGRYINGYEVLVDKDSITSTIDKPTYMEFNIKKPTKEKYEAVVNEFWWNAYYVPKYLWRDELPFSKFMLDNILRYEYLHQVVNWYIGGQHNWQVETGALGKKYKKLLSNKDWEEFESTYVGGGIEENWDAFHKITALFRRLSIELSETLGYDYPAKVDSKVMAFCEGIMATKKK